MKSKKSFISLVLVVMLMLGSISMTASALVAPGSFEVFEGSLDSATATNTHSVDVDFSENASVAFCLVKTGNADITAVVTDSSGSTITTLATWGGDNSFANVSSKRWYIYNRPTGASGISNFNITISTTYFDSNSNYRLMVGNGNDVEAMMGGLENAAILKTYVDSSGNYYAGNYIPNTQEYFFRFIPTSSTTVVTLLSDYSQLRFRFVDPVTFTTVYDSNLDATAHRTRFTNPYTRAEKARLNLTLGKEYYIVVYTPANLQSPNTFLQGYFNLSVGQAQMLSGNATFYSTSSITGTSTTFSPSAIITTTNVPNTAVATRANFRTLTSGIYMSKINYWRVKRADSSTWRTSPSATYPSIDIPYSYGSSSNSLVLGNWNFSFKSYSSSLTMQPGINFEYKYEMGD